MLWWAMLQPKYVGTKLAQTRERMSELWKDPSLKPMIVDDSQLSRFT